MSWRRLSADGCEWEVRAIAADFEHEDILEFRAVGALRQPRRTLVSADALGAMSDDDLLAAYRRALPIGGDHYGRPGKRMLDGS